METRKILVVIPAYREEAKIEGVIAGVRANVPQADVLVIDDGSPDETAIMARRAGALVASLPYNQGYGVALQTGFKYARRHGYDIVVQIDGDGQHEPRCIADLLAVIQSSQADVALGSRWLGAGDYKGPFLRKFGKVFFASLATFLTDLKVTDPTTGFQALSKEVVHFYCTHVYPVDYPDANVIIMLRRAGFRVAEVPVIMYRSETGQSMHAGILKPVFYGMKMMMSIAMTLLRDDRGLRREGPHV
ncbi:MAG TPA: glycosyltransferase family 2 protein [Anaerolineae bacterium]|nr:glycosyltransferase family 2 protein [Anaerolineae bacterium]